MSERFACRALGQHRSTQRKSAVVVEDEAGVVRRIFGWIAQERLSLAVVCQRLLEAGVPSPTGNARSQRSMISVLLANPAALAEGVSLHTVCHDAVYLDRTFTAGQYLQSVNRIHRLGLAPGTDTLTSVLVAQGTVD